MRINSNTVLYGRTVLLVPYGKHHVEKYHKWMENEEIREQTASLPLTLDEEYAMQQTWLNDDDKCTFIILSKEIFEKTKNEIESMIGDVNLFLNDSQDNHCGELEIMIAETNERKKGYGLETLHLFIRYVIETLSISRFIVKIGLNNLSSIALFTEKLLFQTTETSEVFREVTMERYVNEEFLDLIHSQTSNYKVDFYDKFLIKKDT